MAPAPTRPATRPAGRPVSLMQILLARVVEAREPPSRAALSTGTGLSRATVSVLVDHLLAAGLVRELDPERSRRAGRPAVPLAPARGTVAGLGLEVNVDYLGLRALDLAGETLVEQVVYGDLRAVPPEDVLAHLAALAHEALGELAAHGVRVAGAVLALPGLVDEGAGPLRVAPNLGWRDLDVAGLLARDPALAALAPGLGNEANLAATAELRLRDPDDSFCYVSGEVGVGGALVLHGRLVSGLRGWAGEIGHMVVDPAAGRDGTLEQLVGQDALLRAAGLDPAGRVPALVAALAGGDGRAAAVVERAGQVLGTALASVVHVVDVHEVVLGGSFGPIADRLAGPVRAALADRVVFAPWTTFQVSRALAGDLPALTGAAWAALRPVLDDPEGFLAVLR